MSAYTILRNPVALAEFEAGGVHSLSSSKFAALKLLLLQGGHHGWFDAAAMRTGIEVEGRACNHMDTQMPTAERLPPAATPTQLQPAHQSQGGGARTCSPWWA